MLNTFESHTEIEEIMIICDKLRSLKKRIVTADYEDSFGELKQCENLFKDVKEIAIRNKDERLANAQKVYELYFEFFAAFAKYHQSLFDGKYKDSWNYLQDCLDIAKAVGKFLDIEERREVPAIVEILLQYEKMYPYNVFCSSEYIVSKSHCSICGKSMQSLDCAHRKGKLYWGDVAVEMIDEIRKIQAVCLVSHPEDKRCIIETKEQANLPEQERFKKLHDFLEMKINPLQFFDIHSKIERRRDWQIPKMNRNDMCFCGSGNKFKNCCIDKMYYNHERIIISPLWKVQLLM